jgi:hypothetical protein
MESLFMIIGVIVLLAVAGLLNPLRKASGVIAAGVDTMANVSDRKLTELDVQSELDHAKVITKMYVKAEALGDVKTSKDVRLLLKSKYHNTDED